PTFVPRHILVRRTRRPSATPAVHSAPIPAVHATTSETIRYDPPLRVRDAVARLHGFRERTAGPMRRREGPGVGVVVVISFGDEWLIDGERFTSFAAGVHDVQVTTEHAGRSHGMQIDLAPPAAYRLFGLPLRELARR